ncbi:helix-turn-helix transcriptional regulator [Brucella oryzae]|uniref:XRE family transcriptional regulator n=1 Tax=Brucella oryzae TaxID=335286 RepID=UPI001B8439AE|nr:S24 family peptidase [Brucella oryzae]MBR7651419.1 helix-turn-helix transcriptional regulator [Brucella oryzae]
MQISGIVNPVFALMLILLARPETNKTPLAGRLRDIRRALGDLPRDAFAKSLNVSEKTLGNYERGDNEPDASVLLAYKQVYGVDVSWLLTGEGPMFSESATLVPGADLVEIPLYDVQAAAGSGLIPKEDGSHNTVAFSRAFLRSIGAKPENCVMLEAKGDSMLPTIPNGAFMIVDQSKQEIVDEEVFVFRVGAGLKVKRAYWRMNNDLELRSDNEANGYPPEIIGRDMAEELAVIGQVLSLLRKA